MNRCSKKDIVLLIFPINDKGELLWSEYLGNDRYKLFEAVEPFQNGDIVYCDHCLLKENGLIERRELNEQESSELQLEIRDLWRLLGKNGPNR